MLYSNKVCIGQLNFPDPLSLPPYRDSVWKQLHCMQQVPVLFQRMKKELSNKLCYSKPEIPRNFLSSSSFHPNIHELLCVLTTKYPQYQLHDLSDNLYRLHFHVPVYDRRITAHLVSSLQEKAHEYEVDVAKLILDECAEDDFQSFRDQFLQWRSKGLWYPLKLGMKYDPVLQEAFHDWDFSKTLDIDVIKRLDAFAVHMHIKSMQDLDPSTHDFSLRPHLQAFAQLFDQDPDHHLTFKLWHGLTGQIHEYLPPSLFMYCEGPPTWGYQNLALHFIPEKRVLFFEKQSLGVLTQPQNDTHFTPMLQHAVCSLGEKLLSRELSTSIIYPTLSLQYIHHPQDIIPFHREKMQEHIQNYFFLHNLECETKISELPTCPQWENYYRSLQKFLLPPLVKRYHGNVYLTAWKIDTPASPGILCDRRDKNEKAVIYPCEKKKYLINVKENPANCSIHHSHVLTDKLTIDDMRQCLYDYLQGHYLEKPRFYITKEGKKVCNQNLLEAVEFFIKTPPGENQVVMSGLGEDHPWTNHDAIDVRYAEVQESHNAVRYRDWVALYSSPRMTLQARLNAHCLKIEYLYNMTLPWVAPGPYKCVQWVSTAVFPFQVLVADSLKHVIGKYVIRKLSLNKRHYEYYVEDDVMMFIYVDKGELHLVRLYGFD